MQYISFIFKSAIEDFARNKIRTALTSLGILIGVSSVVLLLALGLGFKAYLAQQFESLGTNIIILMPGKVLEGGQFSSDSESAISGARFDQKDVTGLARIEGLEYVVPIFMKTVMATGGGNSEIGDLFATTSDIFPMRNLTAAYGTLFEKSDDEKRSKNLVIGPKIAEKLYGSASDAVGKTIKLEDVSFKIGGVLTPKGGGGFGGPDFDSFIYMPYKTALPFNQEKKIYSIYLKAASEKNIPLLKNEIQKTVGKNHEADDFSVVEQSEILAAVSSIFAMLNTVLVAIAAISLFVGGIGIMNIMFVSVMERIREIGIRRAMGATRQDILLQFLTEAIVLSFLGGLAGLLLSAIVVLVIRNFFPAYIDLYAVALSLGVSSSIGIVFGVIPARKAAKLAPVEAIRYE